MTNKSNTVQRIVGQEALTSEIERIFDIFTNSECQIRPHFILTGESGSGKSFIIKNLTLKYKLGFIEVNAAQLTKEGTAGNSLSKALSPLNQMAGRPVVCFVDEFDKLFISGNCNDSLAHETTTGVQNEFLKVLESDTASVFGDYGKYINVPANNVLFIFAGAFNGETDITLDRLREIGIKTEFLGRVGLVYNTKRLTLDDLYDIIEHSELLDKYLELVENIDRNKVVNDIKGYVKRSYDNNTIGARLINTLIHQYFIKRGSLDEEEVKTISFQNKLKF
jgi:ATP-dependent protease Clp ATPase subunit